MKSSKKSVKSREVSWSLHDLESVVYISRVVQSDLPKAFV